MAKKKEKEDKNPEDEAKKKPREEKPVGEMLRDEGVVAPEETVEEDTQEEEVPEDMNKVLMRIEKIGAVVNTIKEMGSGRDERINELSENIGEIRSLLFQRDATIRELESRTEKLEENVKEIKPRKIEKRMEEREREIEKLMASIEKFDSIQSDLSKKVRKNEKILDNIKSMENLTQIVKDIEEKVSHIENIRDSTKRDSAKAERFYLEMGKRMEDFEKMKDDVERLDEMSKEIMRSVDENRIQLDSKVDKKELDSSLDEITKIPEAGKESKISKLEERKMGIESLLKRLEEQKKDKIISNEAYQEIFEKNRMLLEQINKEMVETNSEEQPADLKEWLSQTEEQIKKMDERLEISEMKRKSIEEKMKDVYSKMEEIGDNLIKVKDKIEVLKKSGTREEKKEMTAKEENLVSKKKQITDLLEHMEEEYRRGNITEKTYEEIKAKNIQKMEQIEEKLGENKKKEETKTEQHEEKNELQIIEEKIESLSQEERKEELKSLLILAKEKLARGYPLLSKKYVKQIKERLEGGL